MFDIVHGFECSFLVANVEDTEGHVVMGLLKLNAFTVHLVLFDQTPEGHLAIHQEEQLGASWAAAGVPGMPGSFHG